MSVEPLPPPGEPAQPQPETTLASRIVRASVLILVAHLIFKFLGLVQASLVMRLCDTVTAELFMFGYDHILLLVFLIGEEAIAPALLPLFMEAREKRGDSAAWRLAGKVASWQFLLLLAATAAVMLFPELPVRWFTQWEDKPEYLARAPDYVRWMAAAFVFVGMSTTAYMALNGYKRFFLAALSDAFVKLAIIAGLLAGVGYAALSLGGRAFFTDRLALMALAGGSLMGFLLKLGVQLWGLRHEVKWFRPGFSWTDDPAFQRFFWLVLPLLAGILFAKGRDIFNGMYILSGLEDGLIKANSAGSKIFKSAGMMVPFAVSIALLPYLCEMVDRDRHDELGQTIDTSSRLMFLAFVPVAAFLVVASFPVTAFLYGGERFTYGDCLRTALSNACYAWVLPFYALEFVFMRAFFSQRRTLAVTVLGVVASGLMIAANAAGILWWGVTGMGALALVAMSYSISRAGKVIALGMWLRRSTPCFAWKATVAFAGRALTVALIGGAAAWLARLGFEAFLPTSTWFNQAVPDAVTGEIDPLAATARIGRLMLISGGALALMGVSWLAATAAAAWFLTRAECLLAWEYAAERLRRRRKKA